MRLKLLVTVFVLMLACGSAAAAPNWVTMVETPTIAYQIDKDALMFSEVDNDVQLDMWMKMLLKDKNGMNIVGHYIVRESDLYFIMKERATYSGSGESMGSVDATDKGWVANTEKSPVGMIAKRLFFEHRGGPKPAAAPTLAAGTYFATYENRGKGFAIRYPQQWKVREGAPSSATAVSFVSPLNSASDSFLENANVTIVELKGDVGITLKAFDEINVAELKKVVTEYQLVQKENVTLGGLPAVLHVFTGRQGTIKLKFRQVYAMATTNKAYTINFVAEESQYADYEEIAKEIAKSFTILR
jgi:hypothetical protein